MWPKIITQKERDREHQRIADRELHNNFENEIEQFFGGEPNSSWYHHMICGKVLLRMGPQIFLKYSKCEYCNSYIGLSPIKRKLSKKLFVLNGYCKELDRAVKPIQRCSFYEPNNFYKKLTYNMVEKSGKFTKSEISKLPWYYLQEEEY